MADRRVGERILEQLGGTNRLQAMISARCVIDDTSEDGGVTIHFKGCQKANCVVITLRATDLYDVTFWKITNTKTKELDTFTNIYASELRHCIENYTGLYLSL